METNFNLMSESPFVSIVNMYTQNHFVINGISKQTQSQYETYLNRIGEFFGKHRLIDIQPYHAEDFFIYLRKRPCGLTRSSMIVAVCKNALDFARKRKLIEINPFHDFEPKYDIQKEIIYPEENELERLINTVTLKKSLEIAKDLYLFQAYTGISYCDLWSFEIVKVADREFIYGRRNKTKNQYWSPFTKEARQIFEKYSGKLPKVVRTKYNQKIRTVADLAGINTYLTSHTARKFYANKMSDKHGLSADALKIILGHKSVFTTNKYYLKAASVSRLEMELNKAGL